MEYEEGPFGGMPPPIDGVIDGVRCDDDDDDALRSCTFEAYCGWAGPALYEDAVAA